MFGIWNGVEDGLIGYTGKDWNGMVHGVMNTRTNAEYIGLALWLKAATL